MSSRDPDRARVGQLHADGVATLGQPGQPRLMPGLAPGARGSRFGAGRAIQGGKAIRHEEAYKRGFAEGEERCVGESRRGGGGRHRARCRRSIENLASLRPRLRRKAE